MVGVYSAQPYMKACFDSVGLGIVRRFLDNVITNDKDALIISVQEETGILLCLAASKLNDHENIVTISSWSCINPQQK